MGSNPHKYTATLVTPAPAVISIPEINWSGSLVDLMNGVPSSDYNDVVYPIVKAAFAAQGYDLESLTNSHWINYNGKLAFTYDMVFDPLTAEIAAAIVAGVAGALVFAIVSLATSWSTWIALVIGAIAAAVVMAVEQVFVIDDGCLFGPCTPPSPPPGGNGSNGGGYQAGSSCSSTSQCAQGLVCQNGTCTKCNGIVIGSTCVPTWALIAGVGAVAVTGIAIAMYKKRPKCPATP